MYDNVSNSMPIQEPSRGLPRLLKDEATRNAEQKVYDNQLALRRELILRGSSIKDKTDRLGKIQKQMQAVIDNSLAGNNKMMESSLDMNQVLSEFSLYKTDPGTAEEGYDANKARTEMVDKLDKAVEELSKIDPIAAMQLRELAVDYSNISQDVTRAVDVYNQLSSSKAAQEQFQQERQSQEEIIKNQERQKEYKEGTEKAKTTKELDELFKDASKEDKALAQKKYDELEKQEQDAFKKYVKIDGNTVQEKLDNLKEISKKDLAPTVRAGLNLAIEHYESTKRKEENGELEVLPEENKNDTVTDKKKGEVEEVFKAENTGKFEAINGGRTIYYDGQQVFIRESNPVDAIGFDKNGKPISITFVDENGNTRKEIDIDTVEPMAVAILGAYAEKMAKQQDVTDPSEIEIHKFQLVFARTQTAYKGKYGALDTQSLQEKVYKLDKLLETNNEAIDKLTQNIASSNATPQQVQSELFTEGNNVADLKKENKKIRTQITKIKNVLGARGESVGLTSDQLSNLESKVLQEVNKLTGEVILSENNIVELQEKIEETNKLVEKYQQEGDTDALTAANNDLKNYQDKLAAEQRSIERNNAFIHFERKQLKRIEDGKNKGSTDSTGQPAPSSTATTEEQVNAGKNQNIDNRAQEEGDAQVAPEVKVTPEGTRVAALYEVLEGKDKEFIDTLRSKGQPAERVNQIIKSRAGNYAAGNQLLQNYKAEDTLNNPEGKSLAELASAHSRLFGPTFVPAKTINDATFNDPKLLEKYYPPGTSYDQAKQAILNYQEFEKGRTEGIGNEVNENTNVNDDAVSAQLEDNAATQESAGPAEQLTPPQSVEGPTFGEALQEAVNRGEAAVPPQENGEELSLKMAGSANVIVDQVANRTRIQVNESGVPLEPVVDELIDVQAKNNLQPGDVLTVQIVEQEGFADTENLPLYLINSEGKYVGKLAAARGANAEAKLKDRQDIINKLRAGQEVQLGVKRVYAPNYNNARTETGAPFFSNPQSVFGGNPELVFQTVTNGVRQLVTTEQGQPTSLANEVQGNVNRRGLNSGQVGFLIPSNQVPGGQPTFSTASTADLTPQAQQRVLDALREGDFDTAKKIVANSTTRDLAERKDDFRKSEFLEFGEFSDGQPYLVYRDNNLGETVRMYGSQVQNALSGKPFSGQFVTLNSDGRYIEKAADKSKFDKLKSDFVTNFENFLKDKKYNIDKNEASTPGQYTSPVTNTSYPSYKDYLFSPQETGGRLGILRTDLVRTRDGSLFHNPIIELTRGNILGGTIQEAAQNTKFAKGGTISLPQAGDQVIGDEIENPFFGDNRLDNDCNL
jgi:hypothetical protein